MRVHTLPPGVSIAPLPAPIQGDVDRVLPGGMPPVPYRSTNAKFTTANKAARSDGTFVGTRMDCLFSHALRERDESRKRGGHGVPAL